MVSILVYIKIIKRKYTWVYKWNQNNLPFSTHSVAQSRTVDNSLTYFWNENRTAIRDIRDSDDNIK